MTPEGIEPSTFGFGIRRATNYAMESKRSEGHWHGSKDTPPPQCRTKTDKKVLSGFEPELEDSESSVIAITL